MSNNNTRQPVQSLYRGSSRDVNRNSGSMNSPNDSETNNLIKDIINNDHCPEDRAYAALLIISCLLLILTIVIYSYYKKLLNDYTRLMRHYATQLCIAMMLLAVSKMWTHDAFSVEVSRLIGFIMQYSFLSSFAFMCSMAIFTWCKIHVANFVPDIWTRNLRICCYSIPFVTSLVTIIVEVSAPTDAKYRPQFDSGNAFFREKLARGIWLYIPLSLSLFFNLFAFVSIVRQLLKVNKNLKNLNISAKTCDKTYRALLYLKMFLGMGVFWILEIIGGLSRGDVPKDESGKSMTCTPEPGWIIVDVINSLQGLWVFVIFVCRRNIINMILISFGIKSKKKSMIETRKKGAKKPIIRTTNATSTPSPEAAFSKDKTETTELFSRNT